MGEDDWRWHMYDTVKGSDWLGDQDAIEYLCRNAPEAVYELEHFGVPFSRTEEGKIYQRAFGGMTSNYGKGIAQRTAAAADRTGHAILHTLYGQCVKQVNFFIEYLASRPHQGRHRRPDGVEPSTMARSIASAPTRSSWRRAATAFVYASCTGAHTQTGDGNAMVLRAGLPLQDMGSFSSPPHRHLRRRRADHRGRARRRRLPHQLEGERFMERYAPNAKDLASRDVVSRSMMIEIREGRGVGPNKDHIFRTCRIWTRRSSTSARRASPKAPASSPAST